MVEILSGNVQRSEANHRTLLEVAAKEGIDIVLIQEPRIFGDQLTITHPLYHCEGSSAQWTHRTKTLTCVRTGVNYSKVILPEEISQGNITAIKLTSPTLHIYNIYRPKRSTDESWTHQRMYEAKHHPNVLLAGDFNRIGLQPEDTAPTEYGLLTFLNESFPILNSLHIPSRGGVLLDLACSNVRGATAYVDPNAFSGSDHQSLHITIPFHFPLPTQHKRRDYVLRFDEKTLLEINDRPPRLLTTYERVAKENPTVDLESLSRNIGLAIETCSSKVKPSSRPNHPFWDEECDQIGRNLAQAKKPKLDLDIANHRKSLHRLIRKKRNAF